MKKKILALIPTRIGSTRLPAKPLLKINNIPLVIHTYKRAQLSKKIDELYICCDDKKIFNLAKKYQFVTLNISQYSARKGTPAARMKQINSKEKHRRSKMIAELDEKILPYSKYQRQL